VLARPAFLAPYVTRPRLVAFIGVGIGMFSGSGSVAISMLLTSLAYWIRTESDHKEESRPSDHPWPYDAAVGLAVLLTLYMMIELRGALPLV